MDGLIVTSMTISAIFTLQKLQKKIPLEAAWILTFRGTVLY
jgi:hypothetical protein